MQIRCYSCKMPISIGRASVEQALDIIHEEDLVYYDFRCPKCKKSNRVSKEQLMHASPAWEYVAPEKTEAKEEKKTETKKKADPKKTETKKKSDTKKMETKKPKKK